jgi:hypothetical protein
VVTVEIKGVPEAFDSIMDKYEFLLELYADLLELADKLNETNINFVVDRTYH